MSYAHIKNLRITVNASAMFVLLHFRQYMFVLKINVTTDIKLFHNKLTWTNKFMLRKIVLYNLCK